MYIMLKYTRVFDHGALDSHDQFQLMPSLNKRKWDTVVSGGATFLQCVLGVK